MAVSAMRRGDIVAESFEQVPDEAYLGFGMAAIFTALALYLMGRKDEGIFVGMLGTSFAILTVLVKIMAQNRTHR